MTTREARGLSTTETEEESVAAYLQHNPEFFERHQALLARLRLPHVRGGSTISLVERQIEVLREKHAALAEAQEIAADAVRKLPYIFRVYTGAQLEHENLSGDPIGTLMQRGYYRGRAADLFIVQKPYWLASQNGTSHGTPFSYDTHVPVIFFGHGIRAGRYDENVRTADIAPTLAALLGVNTPSGSVGRVLPIIEK